MHPPMFRASQLLSDWPSCTLELRCPGCGAVVLYPVRMLLHLAGDQRFAALLPRLSCRHCKSKPAPVYLCASQHRMYCYGAAPDWAVELVPDPKAPSPAAALPTGKP